VGHEKSFKDLGGDVPGSEGENEGQEEFVKGRVPRPGGDAW